MIDYAVPSGMTPEEIEHAIKEESRRCLLLTDWPEPTNAPTKTTATALIDRVINGSYSPDEWLALQKEFNSFVATASAEDIDTLEESGVGEMLYTICSSFEQ